MHTILMAINSGTSVNHGETRMFRLNFEELIFPGPNTVSDTVNDG